MKAYYEAHAKEFLFRENMLKLHIMICARREQASNFAASVVQKASWSAAAKEVTGDSSDDQSPYSDVAPRYYSQSTLYPLELWRAAASLGVNEVSFPVRSADRYYVLQLLATAQQGRQAEYEIVEDEVRQRILIERRRKEYAELLGTLRRRYAVEILLNGTLDNDTLQGSIHE
jgi:parvulin-like peptidyl-prolyl isomerase